MSQLARPVRVLAAFTLALGLLATMPCAFAAFVATTYNYYVAPHGSDANPGTENLPFKTIVRASRVALPGTTIHVAPGTYQGGFKTSMSGTAGARIYYVSSKPWGARIVPPATSKHRIAWENRGNYVDIVGFDVDGSPAHRGVKWTDGIYSAGSYVAIRNNRVHHMARELACTSAGGAGIGIDSYYRGVDSEVSGNTVHDIGPYHCRFMQGIYISTPGSARNNIVFNVGGAAIQLWHDANHVVVANNTVAGSTIGILVGGGDFYHTKGPNDYTMVHNNIVYDNKYGIWEQGATGTHNSYRSNLVFQNGVADWQLRNGLVHSGTIAQAPLFVKYGKNAWPDFRLQPGSPALGKGTLEHAAPNDITGKARPKAGAIDIGAFQH